MLELGAELLAILTVLVYVGAIAVLFLFVVMLLNIRKVELNSLVINYFPIGIFVGLLLLLECSLVVYLFFVDLKTEYFYMEWITYINYTSNIETIGYLFYLLYCHYFLILSLILLVALIGAVILVK